MARAAKETKSKKSKSKDEAPAKKKRGAKDEAPTKKSKRGAKEEKPVKAGKSKRAAKEEKPAKKGKAAKEEKASKGKKSKAEKEDKKSKKAKAKDTEVKKKRGKSRDEDEEDDDAPQPKKGKKGKGADVPAFVFDAYADIDGTLDGIEKDLSMGGGALNLNEQRMSTGLLGLDLVVGKGMVPGWYTVYGPEQSCKSTGAMAIMSSALLSAVPYKAYFDYEGCVVGGSKIVVENKETTIHAIISDELEATRAEGGLNVEDRKLHITSAGVRQNVLSITSKGVKPIHRLVTESGKTVEGYAHPILCVNSEGLLEWKLQEEIAVGDRVVTKAGQPVSYE